MELKLTEKQLQRFWSKVLKTDSCWLWTGTKSDKNYGIICINYLRFRAHRLSAFVHNIPNPENKPFICHTCDNPSCVNPSHLWWGTHQDNMKDMMSKKS